MEPKTVVCVNGSFKPATGAVIPALDGGVLYGQGLFETILIKNGMPEMLERHLNRLITSCRKLAIALPFTPGELSGMLGDTIKRNGFTTGAARMTLTAGTEESKRSNLIIHVRPLPYTKEHYQRGFQAGFVSIRRNERSPLVGHKTTSYFENILARREARASGLDEGLFLNTRGEVAEGAASNVFLVKDGRVITPGNESGLLPGIMRDAVIEACQRQGIRVEQRKVLPDEMQVCEEVFLTNSLLGVMPVASVDNRTVGGKTAGVITRLLMKEIEGSVF